MLGEILAEVKGGPCQLVFSDGSKVRISDVRLSTVRPEPQEPPPPMEELPNRFWKQGVAGKAIPLVELGAFTSEVYELKAEGGLCLVLSPGEMAAVLQVSRLPEQKSFRLLCA